ncbi:MAG: UDP-N-acetylglucosamine diphosphorylase, partial [Pedosphaera sp.]|nr:UDP-N-acetylglucosamine diphosphorylase [Pedosphaera sp.]
MLYSVEILFDLTQTEYSELFADCTFPWDPLKKLKDYIATHLQRQQLHTVVGHAHIGKDVSIGEGTVVEHGAMILGPAIIGKNCKIRHNAYIRENCVIGDNCIVGNSSELKHSILLNNCAMPHFNYV